VPDILKKFVTGGRGSKFYFERRHFETAIGSQDMFIWCYSVQLEIGEKQKNSQLTLYLSQGQQ